MKDTEDNANKWKGIPCSWIRRINIVKMSLLPKAIHRLNAIPIKIPIMLLLNEKKNHPKMFMEPQKILNRQENHREMNKAGGIMLPEFRLYCKAIVIKKVCYWLKKQSYRSVKEIKSTEINLHTLVN